MINIQEFKQTKVGRIPKEWEVVRLGDISKQRNEIVQPEQNRNDKFIGLEHIEKGETKTKDSGLSSDVVSSKFRFFPGDILYGKLRPYLDKAVITDFSGICSTDLLVIERNKDKVYPNFLIYIIHSPDFINHAVLTTSGTNHPRTSWNAIAKFKLGLPPLPEQKKIAEILSTVDQAIEKVDEAIEKTQRLKKGLMQKLLTKGIGHKEFKETGIGRIPNEWEMVRLGEIITYEKGSKPKSLLHQRGKNTLPYLSAETLRTGIFTQWSIVDSECAKVNREDVILIWDGFYCGDSFIGFEGILSSTMIKIEPKNQNLNRRFLFYFLKACFAELNTKISGMYLKHVNRLIFESQKLGLPPLPEQQKIAEILSSLDKRLEYLRERKEKLEIIKKGLMDDLLTGRKRVRLEA